MMFERGKNPKEALGLGLRERLKEIVEKRIDEYFYPTSVKELRLIKDDLKREVEKNLNMYSEIHLKRPQLRKGQPVYEWELSVRIYPEVGVNEEIIESFNIIERRFLWGRPFASIGYPDLMPIPSNPNAILK